MKIGYHASHEQFSPRELLEHARAAEAAGFEMAMCSEHIMPWSARQGHSGHSLAWLGAAMQATSLPFGMVIAPGYRHHPAVLAQAAATLEQMFPGRFWLAIGSGEALNEHVTGEPWPPKEERNRRLLECAKVMRRLWAGETVTHRGQIEVVDARVYSRPERPPRLLGAALTEATAEWMGGWAEGIITVAGPDLKKIIDAFRRGGGEGKPILAQAKLSWAETDEEALAQAMDQWSTNVLPSAIAADLAMPEDFEARAAHVSPDQVRASVRVSADLADHIERIRRVRDLGVSELYLHNVGRNQSAFIEAFGRRVLPAI
ncbi:MAG TPA: TIGR03885 family FMN-dependent LLM class oxidoreductase [Thermoanaerobaculia bacterium]|nr:TIGR03885 family FMN-dependent LLM class oxidoreductase [Thermoanaerobaculia bacterium]